MIIKNNLVTIWLSLLGVWIVNLLLGRGFSVPKSLQYAEKLWNESATPDERNAGFHALYFSLLVSGFFVGAATGILWLLGILPDSLLKTSFVVFSTISLPSLYFMGRSFPAQSYSERWRKERFPKSWKSRKKDEVSGYEHLLVFLFSFVLSCLLSNFLMP